MSKIGIALEELHDEDWLTQLARNYPNIPKGAKVKVVGITRNLYGNFLRVRYNGIIYDVNPWFVEILEK